MRILVTGSAGFVGGHVVDALSLDGHDVLGVDAKAPREGAPGTHVRNDLRDTYFPKDSGFDACVHLAAFGGVARAAQHPRTIFEANANATINLVDQLRKMPSLRRVILASSFSVYGAATPIPWTEETPTGPLEPYAASKMAQELAFVGRGLPLTTLRFSSVYGQRMRLEDSEATIIAKLAGGIAKGEKLTIFEDGYQTRDFVHVSDIVAVIRHLLSEATPSGVVPERRRLLNVCTGEATSLRYAIDTLSKILGKAPVVEYPGTARPGDMRHCRGNPARVQSLLGRPMKSFALGAIDAFAGLA